MEYLPRVGKGHTATAFFFSGVSRAYTHPTECGVIALTDALERVAKEDTLV